jgi:diguanylate cyclase (GGDEF)-like protein
VGAQTGILRSREDLHMWIRERLSLPAETEAALCAAIDEVFRLYEQRWQESKEEAVGAVAAGAAQRLERMRDELRTRDTTARNVAQYFEELVSDLAERTQRDAKTQLLNFRRFMQQVELSLTAAPPGGWCGFGVADITAFKSHNDRLGHAAGDRIIERVAALLRSEVRSSDLIAYQQPDRNIPPLHARFGGDEFCFFLPDLLEPQAAVVVAERYRDAVAAYEWARDDPRLSATAVNVDIGLICVRSDRKGSRLRDSRAVAQELFARADARLYAIKQGRATSVSFECMELDEGQLTDIAVV